MSDPIGGAYDSSGVYQNKKNTTFYLSPLKLSIKIYKLDGFL